MATFLPIAFPPIVKAPIKLVITIVATNIFILYCLLIVNATVTPADPDSIPHISPMTSLQKLDTLLAFFIGKRKITDRDRFFVQSAFVMILCADFCFKILYNYFGMVENRENFISLGICFFFFAQMIFIYRHTRTSDDDWNFPWICCIPLAAIIAMVFLSYFQVLESLMLMAALAYAPTLLCSLIVACKTTGVGFFPKNNAWLIMLGMVLFLLSPNIRAKNHCRARVFSHAVR